LIAAWKDAIPFRYRTYDPDLKAWRFWGGYEERAVGLVLERFPGAEVPPRARTRTEANPRPAGSDHFRVLHLRETAPIELIEGAYRILARMYHPDRGGNGESMQQINGAYAALREQVRP
jgi:hypothetical protein